MCDLDEGISDPLFLAYLADGVNCVVADNVVVVDQMRHDLLELKAVVLLLLLHQQLFVELRRQRVSEEVFLHVPLVILGPGSDDRGELDVESLVGQGEEVGVLIFAVEEEILGDGAARADSGDVCLVLQGSQEVLVHLLLPVLAHEVDIENRSDVFSRGDSLDGAELELVLFVPEHLPGLVFALGQLPFLRVLFQKVIGPQLLLLRAFLFLLLEEDRLLAHIFHLLLLLALRLLLAILLKVIEQPFLFVQLVRSRLDVVHEEQLVEIFVGNAM